MYELLRINYCQEKKGRKGEREREKKGKKEKGREGGRQGGWRRKERRRDNNSCCFQHKNLWFILNDQGQPHDQRKILLEWDHIFHQNKKREVAGELELHYHFTVCGDLICPHCVAGLRYPCWHGCLCRETAEAHKLCLLQGAVDKTNLHQCTNYHLLSRLLSLLSHSKPVYGACVCACMCVFDNTSGVIKGETEGACSLFILQINLVSNPMPSNVLCEGKEGPYTTRMTCI